MKRSGRFWSIVWFIIYCSPLIIVAAPIAIITTIVKHCQERKQLKGKQKELPLEEYKNYGVDL